MSRLPRLLRVRLDGTRREGRSAVRRLRDSEEQFRQVFETAPAGMAVLGLGALDRGRFLRVNEAFCTFTGRPGPALLGLRMADVLHPQEVQAHEAYLRRAVEEAETEPAGVERRFVAAGGEERWGRKATSILRTGDGLEPHLLVVVEDITAAKEAQRALTHAALHDPLTGLPNRTLLSRHLADAAALGERAADRVTVLYVDLDDFKAVNDTHGHAAGDALLREVATLLRGAVREGDSVARLGGDEFAVVCPGLHGARAGAMAVRVQRALTTTVVLPGGEVVPVTASIGLATGADGEEPHQLLDRADRSMYTAKAHRRPAHPARPVLPRPTAPEGGASALHSEGFPGGPGGPGGAGADEAPTVEVLRAALEARALVEQARGYLAARLGSTVAEASVLLAAAAARRGVPVQQLALAVLEERTDASELVG